MAEPARPAPARQLGYVVLRELGARALPCFAALRGRTELVALQTFRRATADEPGGVDAETMALLLRDARCIQRSWHPNLARVRHVDVAQGELLVATEWIDGATLEDLARAARLAACATREAGAALPAPVVARIVLDVAAGVHALHTLKDGMQAPLDAVHGALCPSNVVVGRDGVARAVHLLRPSSTGIGPGSEALGYSAPEALEEGTTVDARADVYALGAILWEAITGRPPYEDGDPARIRKAQRAAPLAPPAREAEGPFAAMLVVAAAALRFDPAQRPRTAAGFASDLRAAVGDDVASGSVVAEWVGRLVGERIRARREALCVRSSGVLRRSDASSDAAAEDAPQVIDVAERGSRPDDAALSGALDRATPASPLFLDPPRSRSGAHPRPVPRGPTRTVKMAEAPPRHALQPPTPLSAEIVVRRREPKPARRARVAIVGVVVAGLVFGLAVGFVARPHVAARRGEPSALATTPAPTPPPTTSASAAPPSPDPAASATAQTTKPRETAKPDDPPAGVAPIPPPRPSRPAPRGKKRYDPLGI